jgi:hypothetical protein
VVLVDLLSEPLLHSLAAAAVGLVDWGDTEAWVQDSVGPVLRVLPLLLELVEDTGARHVHLYVN